MLTFVDISTVRGDKGWGYTREKENKFKKDPITDSLRNKKIYISVWGVSKFNLNYKKLAFVIRPCDEFRRELRRFFLLIYINVCMVVHSLWWVFISVKVAWF